MSDTNPVLQHPPRDFYAPPALVAAKAIRSHDLRSLESTLEIPGVVDATGFRGIPLLVWAIAHGNVEGFASLLRARANPDVSFPVGDLRVSCISLAVRAESPEYLRLLLECGAAPNGVPGTEHPLLTAIHEDREDRLRMLLAAGADINARDSSGLTPILAAAIARNYPLALWLARAGAATSARLNNGTSLSEVLDRHPTDSRSARGLAKSELRGLLR